MTSLLSSIQAQRHSDRKSMTEACAYAAQAVMATLAVEALYHWMGWGTAMWAAISAVLVLQPGFERSLAASAIRVVANLLGAGMAVAASLAIPDRVAAGCVGLAAIILACEVWRLDTGVRAACASVLIIVMAPGQSPLERGVERAAAVSVGCAVALALQLGLHALLQVRMPQVSAPGPRV